MSSGLLYATFALEDRKESMTAFTENAHAALPSSLKGTAPDARTVRATFSAFLGGVERDVDHVFLTADHLADPLRRGSLRVSTP
jgi:hypothetical protein